MQENELGSGSTCPVDGQTQNSLILYTVAKNCLGISLVPPGDDPEYGCAISLNMLALKAWGRQIGGGASTALLLQDLIIGPFREIDESKERVEPGDIIMSATGTSTIKNPPIPNGHVGVIGSYGIMSNNSNNGLWQEVYTLASWKQRYEIEGKYPTRIFRRI